ncbi:MAG: alcohol dehydrogenase catalytic domain-containing protein [Alphaproteobacteria bacterium]|nr:alcohol dehydrogenase catalytic domain-containing protein [Alphaproteobacteria bacterium]
MKSQAITAFGQPLEEVTGDTPQPQGAEVVVKVSHCGVCHSDVHIHDGYFDMGGGNKLDMTRGIKLPFTMGHEIEGEVVAVGPDVTGAKVGDRRVVFPWIGCGHCAICARGDEHLCNAPRQLGVNIAGGYADAVLVPHERYLLDYEGIPEGLAATYMCSGLTAFSALKKIGTPGPDDAVLIVGAGGVGMMGVQFARALFETAPLVADISAEKLAAAQKAGAGATYDASDAAIVKQIRTDTGGGVFAAIDFVGSESSFALARGSLRKGGTAVVVGLFGGAFSMPIPMLPFTSMQLKGSFVGSLAETREMLELVKQDAVDPIPVAERPLDQASATLDDLRAGRIVGRVVLRP